MNVRLSGRFGLGLALALSASTGSPPSSAAEENSPPIPVAYQQEIEAWRASRVAGLKGDLGWLSDVGRIRLDEGESRFGSDPSAQVPLPLGKAPTFAGSFVRHGNTVTLVPAPGLMPPLTAERHPVLDHGSLGAASAGAAVTGPLVLADDSSQEGPTVVHLRALSLYLIHRFDNVIVRVKDAEAPAIIAFKGIETFPVRSDWRVVARFETYAPPKPVTISNVVGETEEATADGAAVFEHGGKTYRLDAFEETGGRLFIILGDQTNGFETYGAGRFLDTDPVAKDGHVILDFNKAYNPPCALSTFAVCPLPPPQNRLPLRVLAGEKTYRSPHG